MARSQPRILWAGVEPTPYLVALQQRARQHLPYAFDVVYERKQASQAWEELPGTHRVLNGRIEACRLVARVVSGAYDAVLLEGWGTLVLSAIGLAAAWSRRPYVLSGDTHDGTAGHTAGIRNKIRRHLFRHSAATLPGGSPQRRFFLAQGANPATIVVRQMTVDVEMFRAGAEQARKRRDEIRADLEIGRSEPIILGVGRLAREKGFDVLIRAFSRLAPARLLIVGSGPEADNLRTLATGVGVASRTLWPGRLDLGRMIEMYAIADVLAVPSRWEPWGLVVNEAMACGLPVVATDAVGAAEDLLAGTGAGMIVPTGDEDALTLALARLCEDPALRGRMGSAAAARIGSWTYREEVAAIDGALRVALRMNDPRACGQP